MDKNSPIGVLDSGVGGLTVLTYLQQKMPHENFIFVGDTGRAPYGSRPEAQIREFVEEEISWLEKQNIKLLVIACNTITNLGINTLIKDHHCYFMGMSRAEQLLMASSRNKKIGVMATEFTIKSEANKKAILAYDPTAEVYPVACPKYVPLVENEQFGTPAMLAAIKEYAAPLKNAGIDVLLLACTHYPFMKEYLAEEMGNGVKIVDPAEDTAMVTKKVLQVLDLLKDEGEGSVTVCCTKGKDTVERLAKRVMKTDKITYKEIAL